MTAELTTSFRLLLPHGRFRNAELTALDAFVGGIEHYGHERPIRLADLIDGGLALALVLWCLRAVVAWQAPQRDRLCRAFAADCADRVLPLFEDERPDDARPRRAIAAARSAAANAETEAALAAAFAAATQAGGALRAAARSADDDRARRLRRAATAAEVAADTCRPAPWEAAYDAPIRAATYLFGRDPGLPMGPEWEAETAWQAACLRRHLDWLPEIG